MNRMTLSRLRWLSVWHYRATNVAVVLGVMVGTAVMGGALIVGDSVRASLRQMTLDRLGQVDAVVTGPRFFREALVDELRTAVGSEAELAPGLVLVGSVEQVTPERTRRAGRVNVYGVDPRSWALIDEGSGAPPQAGGVHLNARLAEALGVEVGGSLTLWLELPSAVPRDTLLGKKDNDATEVSVTVASILEDRPGAAQFGLLPTQQLPLNLFIELATLQNALDLAAIAPSRRDPVGQPGRINTIFARDPTGAAAPTFAARLDEHLRTEWQLADWHLRTVHDTALNVVSVESEQMLLEDRFAKRILEVGRREQLPTSPVMVYLANWLKHATNDKAYSMYSTVAGLELLDLDEAFGPFEFVGPTPESWGDEDVILNEFLAKDLQVNVGDTIRFAYHVVGSHGELPEVERTATVRGIVAMTGAAIDRQLTPTVKGITDADSLDDWEQPFTMDLDAVTPRDDEYWNDYWATPKAFFRLATAQRLWPNRYGTYTSVRVAPQPGQTIAELSTLLERELLAGFTPAEVGMGFLPVRAQGLAAANGATDFTGLFLGFSLFLILAAVILVGLLFRLAVDQRVRQWGLLGALGLSAKQTRGLMLGEGLVLVVIGGALGALAAVGYAQLMLYGLKTWWIGAIGTKFLRLDVQPLSLLIGVLAAVGTSLIAIVWSLRQLDQLSLREQLAGVLEREGSGSLSGASRPWRVAVIAGGLALSLILGVIVGLLPTGEAFSGLTWSVVSFFLAGVLLLVAALNGLSAWLQRPTPTPVRGRGLAAVSRLGRRNAARRRQRSVWTAGLMASAAFVVAAVAAGQKNPVREAPDKSSGNGGFTLVAETSSPILYDLNTPEGRKTLNITAKTPAQQAALEAMTVIAFRVKPGEDASCLNLFQTSVPTVLGVPTRMIDRGGFPFVGGGAKPWDVLNTVEDDGSYPVLGDMNTLMFSLKKGPGTTIPVPSAEAPTHRLKVAGMFNGAVFQGVLLLSEANFMALYPERKGYQYFLIDVPLEHMAAAAELLETELAEYGFDAEPVAERLARFLAVQNTYLSTFQALGGLGQLLGTIGLATVMLRNVLERRAELALLRAVGFPPRHLARMVLAEAGLLLGWGIVSGTAAALLAMAPHLLSTGAELPWLTGGLLLVGTLTLGLVATSAAVRAATRVPIVTTLRGE